MDRPSCLHQTFLTKPGAYRSHFPAMVSSRSNGTSCPPSYWDFCLCGMDSDIKKQCEALYNELGMNLTTAINVFLRQSLRVGGLPFNVRVEQPNKETIAAMLEAERISRDPSVKRYSDVEEALKALKE